MICPRCGKEIADSETLCPFCMHEIDKNVEFNNFRQDGFVQLQTKEGSQKKEAANLTPKYFNIAELNIFVIAVVYILLVCVFTVFSLRFVQKTHVEYVEPYTTTKPTEPTTEPPTEKIRNDVKKLSVKNMYGSWKLSTDEETSDRAISYYTFNSDGSAQQNYGSIVSTGTFKDVSTDKQEHLVYIRIGSSFRGDYIYNVTGNKKDGYTLTLIDESANRVYTFVQAKAQTWTLKPPKKNKIDRDLVGTWYTEDKLKAYKFDSDGTLKRVSGETSTTGIWSVNKEKIITIRYMRDVITEREVSYKVGKGRKRIRVNGVLYYNKNSLPAQKSE